MGRLLFVPIIASYATYSSIANVTAMPLEFNAFTPALKEMEEKEGKEEGKAYRAPKAREKKGDFRI